MDALLGSSNPYLSVVRPWKEVHCAAFEPPTSAALSSPIVWQRTGKHCQANTPELAQGTIAILPCVHCRLPAAFLKALLSPIPRKDRQSGGPGRSGLSQAHIFLIDSNICRIWKNKTNIHGNFLFHLFVFFLCLSWIICWGLFASENYHLLPQFLDFKKWCNAQYWKQTTETQKLLPVVSSQIIFYSLYFKMGFQGWLSAFAVLQPLFWQAALQYQCVYFEAESNDVEAFICVHLFWYLAKLRENLRALSKALSGSLAIRHVLPDRSLCNLFRENILFIKKCHCLWYKYNGNYDNWWKTSHLMAITIYLPEFLVNA